MPKYFQILELLTHEDNHTDLLQLDRLVRSGSPYIAPAISNPKMRQVIHELGGWVSVCAQYPDAEQNPIAYAQYAKRFEQALNAATKKIEIQKEIPCAPRALGMPQLSAGLEDSAR